MLKFEEKENIFYLFMNHNKVNSLDIEFCQALIDKLKEVETSAAKAVVLTGNEKVFSAGVDLLRLVKEDNQYLENFIEILSDLFIKLFTFSKPLIAAINGHAIAGGCIIACAADYRIMSDNKGTIGLPERRVGVPFPSIALEIVRFATLPRHFQKLIYSGVTFKPQEAFEVGLIDELAVAEELMTQAGKIAQDFSNIPANIFALTKAQIRQPVMDQVKISDKEFKENVKEIWLNPKTRQVIEDYISRTFKKEK